MDKRAQQPLQLALTLKDVLRRLRGACEFQDYYDYRDYNIYIVHYSTFTVEYIFQNTLEYMTRDYSIDYSK